MTRGRPLEQVRPRLVGIVGAVITACLGAAGACGDAPTAGQSGTPRIVWSVQGDVAAAQPFADADIAVFTESHSGRVVALDPNTGRLRWASFVGGGPPGLGLPESSSVAYGDLVIVGAWELFAFSRTTGDLRWSFMPDSEYPAAAPIALVDSLVITPGGNSRIFAVNARTGALVWQRTLGERPFGSVVAGGIIYVGASGYASDRVTLAAGHAYALRATDGSILWSSSLPNSPNGNWLGGTNSTGALSDDAFIVASTSGRVWAFDRASGSTRWVFDGPAPFLSGVAIIGKIAVVAALNGDIIGLDVKDGAVRWRRSTGGSSVLQQVTSDSSCAYVAVVALMCLSETGDLRWELGGASRGGPLFMTAAFPHGGRLFIGSMTGFHAIAP